MTEETQALFDLLIKPDLTKADIRRLKAVATGLYETLEAKISAIQDFAAKQATRDHVKQAIQDYLMRDNGLPDSYDMPEIALKADAVYAHLLMQAGQGGELRL